jgi:hypothetical protein
LFAVDSREPGFTPTLVPVDVVDARSGDARTRRTFVDIEVAGITGPSSFARARPTVDAVNTLAV